MPNHSKGYRAEEVARTFFKACTKLSDNKEDILPQVRGRENLRCHHISNTASPTTRWRARVREFDAHMLF